MGGNGLVVEMGSYIYIILYILDIYYIYIYIIYYIYIWFGHIHGNSDLNSENSGLLHPPKVRISSARHGVDVSPPLRLLVPNPDTVRFSYIMERGTGSGLLLKMFCGTPVALRFCFLMQKHVHS